MIKWLFKYGAVIFLFNTVLLAIDYTRFVGNYIFLFLMAIYALVLLINPQQIKNIIFHKAFSFLLIINILNLLYFLLFHSFTDIEAIQYLLARGVQFSIISVSIYFNYDYYKVRFLDHLVYLVAFIIFLGLLYNPFIFSDRYSGIIWNPNMLSSYTSIAFAILFLSQKQKSRSILILLYILAIITLATGSRGVLVAIVLAFLFKYTFSNRNIIYLLLALIFYFTLINFQFDTSINRFASQSLFNDRILQYQYAFETLFQKPIIGFGLDKYAYINPEIIPYYLRGYTISAHNGYLAILTQYGLIFGGIILFIILSKSYKLFIYFRRYNDSEKTYLFIIIYALLASFYETLITGINEFHTSLFWFSLAFLSFSKFKENHES